MFQRLHAPHCLALQIPLFLYDLPLALESATGFSSVALARPLSHTLLGLLGAPAGLAFLPPPEMPFSFLIARRVIHSWASSSCHRRIHPHPPAPFLSRVPPHPLLAPRTNSHIYFCTYPSLTCVLYGGCSLNVRTPKLLQGATSQARVPGRFRGTLGSGRFWRYGSHSQVRLPILLSSPHR